jgi:Ohr subfamily peroxiredoxin
MTDALYTASATATGGRTGHAVTSDGALEVDLVVPSELGGDGGPGTNPEQLFAAGYSACFLSALSLMAGKRGIDTSAATVTADVSLRSEGRGFGLAVDLRVRMPGVERELAEKLVAKAHQVCPYSNATRGNIEVTLTIEEPAAPSAEGALAAR